MKSDFSGYVTKAGLRCSDGRTIMPDAFKHQDTMQVPLVWQHGHNDPENVLGHVILENRDDGVYGYGFFNGTSKAKHTQTALEHKDFNAMSIWANQLIERSKSVLHGVIREVSLVLSGANPGALIENITIRHSADGEDDEVLEDEAIIRTGLPLEHGEEIEEEEEPKKDSEVEDEKTEDTEEDVKVKEVYDSMTDEQKEVVHSLLGKALMSGKEIVHEDDGEKTIQDVYDSMTEEQQVACNWLVGEALASSDSATHSDTDDDDTEPKKGNEMKHNVFENEKGEEVVLSHADMEGIIADATRSGSLRASVEAYALAHNITDIDVLFPDAVATDRTPEFDSRRMEWVSSFLGAVKKSPFGRIKTLRADITEAEARAKGYITGTLKKEEFFKVTKRETTPTTIYKKQSLDRDDVVDITDFDVVTWLKAEMRLLLDEELARAALIGDGRDISDEDKIQEGNIRPIAKEHELFATTINVNIDDASSSVDEITDMIIKNRRHYKGSGQPTFYTTETYIGMFLLKRDGFGRRLYSNLSEVASELRVKEIVSVEAMEEDPTLIGVIVNPVDYTLGATKGGEVSMFEDFDIDYNKQKYLIETRCSGALTKLKSALVVRKVASNLVLVESINAPTFDAEAGELTIVDTAHVVYKNVDTDATITNSGSPYSVDSGETINVKATPATGYYFATSEDDEWSFTAD